MTQRRGDLHRSELRPLLRRDLELVPLHAMKNSDYGQSHIWILGVDGKKVYKS